MRPLALAALLVFPVYFLRSFAYAGVGVTVFAALSALLVLPALLAVLGHRVNSGRIPGVKAVRSAEAPFWGHLAKAVMRRPADGPVVPPNPVSYPRPSAEAEGFEPSVPLRAQHISSVSHSAALARFLGPPGVTTGR